MTKVTLTVACHIDDLDDARNLAVCLGWLNGYAPDEWWGAFSASYLTGQGEGARALCMMVGETFVQQAATDQHLTRPPADTENQINMAAANRGNDKKVVWMPTEPEQPVPQVERGKIVAVVGLNGRDALAHMGLTAPHME